MGYSRAMGMADYVRRGVVSIESALMDHFIANMYPPVPLAMIESGKAAIDAIHQGDPERMIDLPPSLMMKGGSGEFVQTMKAQELTDILRLGAYI